MEIELHFEIHIIATGDSFQIHSHWHIHENKLKATQSLPPIALAARPLLVLTISNSWL